MNKGIILCYGRDKGFTSDVIGRTIGAIGVTIVGYLNEVIW